ncbi:caspase family protein [Sandaracinobacter sp. RS1-74]|uniref:caspase family protein n=1 Tax=Sandaracinobacteroides sayramensis TaxID=2913411 RepID=UPI001EDB4A4F|nr:caspase family protein [Sandaracinobacteroides sayramensis]MCG2839586.1 caspase family protein [Sandaracinobacteroides sayramensis]
MPRSLSQSLAIVIGIDAYEPEFASLRGAVADAHDIALWLLQSGEVSANRLHLGLAPTDRSPPLPEALAQCRAFTPDIDGLDELLCDLLANYEAPAEAKARFPRLIFSFSGHGAISANPVYEAEALGLAGFSGRRWRRALELQSLLQTLRAFPATERLVWIDGCRSAVNADTAQFGRLADARRGDEAVLREHVLRATTVGRKAAETGNRGLFTRHLVEGLKGAGDAKRWDPDLFDGAGGYAVRWNALVDHVANAVATSHAAARQQLVSRSGEASGGSDPLLATFRAETFGAEEVALVAVAESGAAADTVLLVGRRDQSFDEVRHSTRPGQEVRLRLAPSGWTFAASAPGCIAMPRLKAVAVYGPGLSERFVLLPDDPVRGGAFQLAAPEPTGIRLTLAGRKIEELVPLPRISILHDSGATMLDPVLQSGVNPLPPGLYRVRIEAAGGQAAEHSVAVEKGRTTRVELEQPGRPDSASAEMLMRMGRPVAADGFAMPSEAAGELFDISLATTALLASAGRQLGRAGSLDALQLGLLPDPASTTGLEVLMVNSRLEPDLEPGSVAPRARLPRARLWEMARKNDGLDARLRASPGEPAFSSAGFAAGPGPWWLELQDADREARRGFKLATAVFAEHVTLVLRDRLQTGGVAILQMALPRRAELRAGNVRTALQGLVKAEAFQRARAQGRDPLADPQLAGLVSGSWFEPFSALLAGAALLDAGEAARPMLDTLLMRIAEQRIDGPDLAVLKAAVTPDPAQEMALIRDALGMRAAPVVDRLLVRLAASASRLRLFGKEQRWVAEKRSQSVGHRLWTMRREDDKRRAGMPDLG